MSRLPAVTHYDILQVSPTASAEVIRAAYKSLMQLNHPDRHPGDAAKAELAARIAQAYEQLSDPARRQAYDAQLRAAASPPAYPPPPPARPATADPGLGAAAARARTRSAAAPARSGSRFWPWALVGGVAAAALAWWFQPGARPAADTLETLRTAMAAPERTEAERRALFARKLALLAQDPAARARHQQELLADREAALMRLFDQPLTLELAGSTAADAPPERYRVTIPALQLRLGSVDRAKLLAHLERQRDSLQRQVISHLERQSGAQLLRAGGETVLEGWILDALDTALNTRRGDEYPSTFLESPGRYGVVAAVMPDGFRIQPATAP